MHINSAYEIKMRHCFKFFYRGKHGLGYPHEHIEIQLTYSERNKVSAVYNHAEYLDRRKVKLQDWANYLDAIKTRADVLQFKIKVV